jgi:hypothetical protein
MRTRQACELPAALEGLRRRFERWRQTHPARARIPESLWAAAVKMAGTYGLHRTARALPVEYYSLKKRVERESATTAAVVTDGAAGTTFLELAPPADRSSAAAPADGYECMLELEDAGGAKMRIHLKGAEPPDLTALSRSFWNPAS